ncbi:MAG TPA: C40 family peptidase [Gemmatimonadales bacterium]|nr:C40 family peptidase [Gemmatimonadales bacterium]
MRLPGSLPLLLVPGVLAGQGREVELRVGRWWSDGRAASYELTTTYPLGGGFSHGLAGIVLVDDRLGRNRAFYGLGYELQAWRGRRTFAPYAVMGLAAGLSTDTTTQELGLQWSLGGGVEWRPFDWVVLGAQARYRVEDRGPRGFWRLRGDSRDGPSLALGLGLSLGPRAGREAGRRAEGATSAGLPPLSRPARVLGDAAPVVETALDALGSPYRWGGTAENGFDCSGLIQYAYGQHGIRLPRMSRDQARVGSEVTPVVEALKPGDILLFSARPGGGVTHVGMYVGEGRFIHSSNAGVRLSRLDPRDPEAGWWLGRWVGVRRVIP